MVTSAYSKTSLPTSPIGYASDEVWFHHLVGSLDETIGDLAWPTSVATYGQMRRDGQLSGVYSAYTLPLRRATWEIDPTGCRPEVTQVVADDLGLRLKGADEPTAARVRGVSWAEHVRLAMLHLTYGHMGFELGATIDERTGLARLTSLAERMPHTIVEMDVGRNGELLGVSQFAMPGDPTNPIIDASRLLWYAHDREGGAWQGVSLFRSAYPYWLIKREMMRVHATSNRRFGMGVPTVEWAPGSNPTPAQHAEAQRAASAARVGDQAGLALPPGAHLVLAGLSGGVPNTLDFMQWLDRQMSRAALTGFLDLGETPNGSRALGASFIDLFLLALQSVADYVSDTLTRQVAARVVEWNWGPDEPVPAITVSDVGSSHAVTAEAISLLLQSGALAPDPALDDYLRREWRLPSRTTPWVDPKAQPVHPPSPTNVPPQDQVQASSRKPRHVRAAAGGQPREPSDAEQQAGTDFAAHQQAHDDAVAALLAAWPAIVAALILLLGKDAADAVAAGNVAALGALTVPADVVAEVGNELAAHMDNLAQHAAGQVVAEAAHQGVDIATPDAAGADQVAQVAQAVAGMMANGYQTAAAKTAMQAAHPGATAKTVEDAVITALDDMSSADSGWVVSELSGALTAAQNAGRFAVMEAHPPTRVVASELNDSNSCLPCKDIDGAEYQSVAAARADYPIVGYKGCLGGIRCRGMAVPLWG